MTPPIRPVSPAVPGWREWFRPSAIRMPGPRAAGAFGRTPADASRFATRREQEEVAAAPSLLDRIQESATRVARTAIEHPVRTVADMLPGIGDALAVKDAAGAIRERNWPIAGLALASIIPGIPSAGRGVKKVAEAAKPRLSVLHNLFEPGVAAADKLGGIPSPSLAVLREDLPFDQYGEVTLVGTRELGDPGLERVYDRDIYSARQPRPEYPRVKAARWKDANALASEFRGPWDDTGTEYEVLEALMDKRGPQVETVLSRTERPGVLAAFLRAHGVELPEPPVHVNTRGESMLDLPAAREQLRALAAPLGGNDAVVAWLRQRIDPFLGAPSVRVGRKAQPYTLENVAQAMTGKGVRAQEETLVYGTGKSAAAAARKLPDLETARREAAVRQASPEAVKAGREAADKVAEDFREAVREFYGYPDIWEAYNDAMKALGRLKVKNPTREQLRAELRRLDFKDVPDAVLDLGLQAHRALGDAPVPYFEGKPARGVSLGEFPGAVVPEGAGPSVREPLERRGIQIETYDPNVPGSRKAALDAVRRKLQEQGHQTLFSLAPLVALGLLKQHGLTLEDAEEL